MELHSGRNQEIGRIPPSMFKVHVRDLEADTFHELCTIEAHRAAINSKHDYEQPVEMAGTCDENAR